MKYLSVIIFLGLLLNADEIDRMEVMVKDIEKLRSNYSQCQEELEKQIHNNIIPFGELENSLKREIVEKNKTIQEYKKRLDKQTVDNIVPRIDTKKVINEKDKIIRSYKKRLNEEMFKNSILISKLNLAKKNNNFEKPTNKLNEIVKTKEKEINNLKYEILQLKKSKEKMKNNLIISKKEEVVCAEDNKFPKLIMKDSLKDKISTSEKTSIQKEIKKKVKASTFRLKVDSDIYGSLNGDIIYHWKKGTSFTSYMMTENWIKITGHFNAGQWGRAKEELWIKKVNIIKR